MTRPQLHIREAAPADADALIRLWARTGVPTEDTDQARAEARQALAGLALDPDVQLLVGEVEHRIVAAIHLQRASVSPLRVEQAMHASQLRVDPDMRRHGYAHLLLEAAVAWAEEKGITQFTTITESSSREDNRFLARLGLAHGATIRVTQTAALGKKLTAARCRRPDAATHRKAAHVLAQRRSMRRRESDL